MAGSLSFRRRYCISKGKASAGYRFADHSRSGGKALSRAERWKRGLVRSEPSCSHHWRSKSRHMDLTLQSLSPGLFQPIAADDVAAIVADVALAAPRNGIVEIAGPE